KHQRQRKACGQRAVGTKGVATQHDSYPALISLLGSIAESACSLRQKHYNPISYGINLTQILIHGQSPARSFIAVR
ncbi:MAG: hypothetical protein QF894_09000, partial [Alphaproteobacteria bacterium]|nr:hypothetical protein [Alphaproteobacteria bacterium]